MAGYPAAIAESEMYISQLLFTIALDTSHKPVARGHHTTFYNKNGTSVIDYCIVDKYSFDII